MTNKKKSDKSLKQSKFKEIPMQADLIDEIFDSSKRMGFETEEERELREQKEDYNEILMKLIKKVPLTDRQKEIFTLMYVDGLKLTEVSRRLNVSPQRIDNAKNAIFQKIKEKIRYDFKFVEKSNEPKTIDLNSFFGNLG